MKDFFSKALQAKAISLFCVSAIFFPSNANCQEGLQPYSPSHQQIVANYWAAAARDSNVKNTIFRGNVQAHWLPGGKNFWYSNQLPNKAVEYILVQAETGRKQPLFDQQKLAALLAATIITPTPEAAGLQLEKLAYNEESKTIYFNYGKQAYAYELQKDSLAKLDSLPWQSESSRPFQEPPSRWESFATDSISPDKKYSAYVQNNNVYIRSVQGGESIQYTKDGSDKQPYGALAWSPDSRYVVGYRITPVKDSSVYYVLTSVPGTTRGQLRSQPYKQPGDPFTTYEMFVFPVQQRESIKVQTEIIDFFDAPLLHWTKNNRYFYYEKVDRGHQRFRIIETDAQTGKTRTVVDEQAKTFIYTNRIFTHYLPETEEIIWTSEKDGWRHLYLVDAKRGVVKNEITKGAYVVKDIDSIDGKKRQIWFSANGMNPGEDPYYVHFYRIGFDGKNLVSLTPERANHAVAFSPDRQFYLDTYSEVSKPPATDLRLTATGKKIAELERADIGAYLSVVKRLPQPFTAKGRDGVTDIWGVVCLPADFDSTKQYPVIENIYAGPQDAFVPKRFIGYNREMQSLADLGFIVVQIDGMGTANRSKAFHDVCWQNLADAGFADRILWIKALAKKYPQVDTTRVGLYGTSAGGQNALGGLLFHPEFYKAAVAACGCHDNRVDKQWWNEQWMGYPVGKHYEEQSNVINAHKLQGNLLLIVGEADTNVPPESTYRVADALIKAGKTFDFLPIPGMGHSDGGPYGRARKRDFFVRYLLGAEPPHRNEREL